jgi:hypothetical protein
MSATAWLDISIIQCPNCKHYYADASWYVVEMGADIECGTCHTTFNTKKTMTDRVMLSLKIDDEGKVHDADVARHLSKRKKA